MTIKVGDKVPEATLSESIEFGEAPFARIGPLDNPPSRLAARWTGLDPPRDPRVPVGAR